MPSPPRSLDETVQRIARALADDDGTGWWGEEECGPGHVDAARRLAEAAGLPALLERLREVERELEVAGWMDMTATAKQWEGAATSAEARVAELKEENGRRRQQMRDARDALAAGNGEAAWDALNRHEALAQGAAAPLPATEGGNDGND